jgi:hypothetical protein
MTKQKLWEVTTVKDIEEIHKLGGDNMKWRSPLLGSPYDFSQTGELIRRAAENTRTWLAEGGMTRREVPHQMRTHMHH